MNVISDRQRPSFEVGVYLKFSLDETTSWLFNMRTREEAVKWCRENKDLLDRRNEYYIGNPVEV